MATASFSPFLSAPAKRPINSNTIMPDPNPNYPNGSSANKRSKPQPSASAAPLPVPSGHVSFRLLCHASRIGGVIGKAGNIIKGLQQQTGAKVRIEDAPSDSPDRVITVIGPITQSAVVFSRIESAVEVSKGQEALVRVFERILEVAAESDSVADGVVSCRMLAEVSSVGAVIGKGGKVVEKIRKDCGCRIKVLVDKLPDCAASNEEMIEIEGDVSAVKKGLVAVSRCLQDCQPVDKTRVTNSKPAEAVSRVSLSDVRVEINPRHSAVLPTIAQNSSVLPTIPQHSLGLPTIPKSSINYASRVHPLSLESDRVVTPDTNIPQQVVFRILCTTDRIGGVIGKGGNIVRALQNETGAAISVGPTVSECDERLITVTASENPESRYSAAQKTIVLVFSRAVESGIEKGLDPGSSRGSPVTARLVVSPSQVGCLLGKGGTIISEMRKATSTSIRIIVGDQRNPKCVPETDHVVEISGDFVNVKDAIYHVTGRLRDNLFSGMLSTPGARSNSSVLAEISPYVKLMDPVRDSSWEPVRDPLRDAFRDPLREPVRDPFRETVRDPFREPVRDPFREPVRDLFREPVRDPLREPARDSAPYIMQPTPGNSHNLSRQTVITQNMDHLGLSHSLDRPPSPRLWASQTIPRVNPRGISDVSRRLPSLKAGLELGSGGKSAFVTNTTVEIVVPENAFGSVYGENGSNLARLRQLLFLMLAGVLA
ncbi:KH domain-containing protein HEN4 isoform X5 [Populus trichocarpa]|uniref:KH domain-containing protein HEN4 isoform X5 n=1 Tax=Populus trichocarpa TaxID=3694 RepID=UPI000D189EEA|nr:KH domain-containing protein HEN4 isoform X5 [Populus trichocarpa]|eukprot:XP_024444266.1 KH domain-containing protein HEN4 isoform X5 [Populus trichocarpa]